MNAIIEIQNAIEESDIERARFLLRYELQRSPSAVVFILAARVAVDEDQRKMFLEKAINVT